MDWLEPKDASNPKIKYQSHPSHPKVIHYQTPRITSVPSIIQWVLLITAVQNLLHTTTDDVSIIYAPFHFSKPFQPRNVVSFYNIIPVSPATERMVVNEPRSQFLRSYSTDCIII